MICNIMESNTFEQETRKRRRSEIYQQNAKDEISTDATAASNASTPTSIGFTNAAFSSTPKKIIGRRRIQNKPNAIANNFITAHNLEEKSIADIVKEKLNAENIPVNPYEVVRKPPKKKKCDCQIAEACFVNPGLNLEIPEKQFNPYEVQRENVNHMPQCFVNEALNIRGHDIPASRNPYEIQRNPQISEAATNPDGVENKGLEEIGPAKLTIGLPFKPTVGCRIDFKNIPLSELTPSKLLAEKLVFSPVTLPKKRSLGSIKEETTMDIGKELDLYQLELENSINEAKLHKNYGSLEEHKKDRSLTVITEVEETVTVTQKVKETMITTEHEVEEKTNNVEIIKKEKFENIECNSGNMEIQKLNEENYIETEEQNGYLLKGDPNNLNSNDVEYASESEEDDDLEDFKTPAPFVRAYRRPQSQPELRATSKESINSLKSVKSSNSDHKANKNLKNVIRSSLRKLIHSNGNLKDKEIGDHEDGDNEKHHTNIINTIRHSLRRRPGKQLLIEDETICLPDISIIDTSERTLKLKTKQPETEYVKIEQLTNERKHGIRNSIRKSTKDLINAVFHKKQDEYDFCK